MLPFCSEADVDNFGTIAGATVTGWNAALTIFLAQLAAAGRTQLNGMVLLHSSATAPTPVVTLTLRTTAGTVRKRQLV